jgi:hypothetical protein
MPQLFGRSPVFVNEKEFPVRQALAGLTVNPAFGDVPDPITTEAVVWHPYKSVIVTV